MQTQAPTSDKPAFWQRQDHPSGNCDERILSQVWTLEPGPQSEHWNLYATYSQEYLRQEVVSNWQSWLSSRPMASYVPWVWALKVYLWRFPLDTQFFEEQRAEMGPFWLMHVRHSEEDWMWLYSVRDSIPMNVMTLLLGMMPVHAIGKALAVDIPPIFEGYESHELEQHKNRIHFVLSQPAAALLQNYGDVLLHPQAHFYPRWRALLVCLHNCLSELRKGKKKTIDTLVQNVLDKSCAWLNLTPRTLLKGFDSSWIAFVKERNCTSMAAWDAAVIEYGRPKNWREQLRAEAASKQVSSAAILV